jgi:dTDP-4-amino-4,6-dideoxygalactose transaminase
VIIDECPVAAAMTGQVLSLPVHPHLSDADITRIVDAVRAALL